MPVLDKLIASPRILVEVLFELEVLLDGQAASVFYQVLQRDFRLALLQLVDTRGLLQTELLCQNLHRHNVEEAALHVDSHKQAEHAVSDVELFLSGASPPLRLATRRLLIHLLLSVSFSLELLALVFGKLDEVFELVIDPCHVSLSLQTVLVYGVHEVLSGFVELGRLENFEGHRSVAALRLLIELRDRVADAKLYLQLQGGLTVVVPLWELRCVFSLKMCFLKVLGRISSLRHRGEVFLASDTVLRK